PAPAPVPFVILAGAGATFFVLPLLGLLVGAPWRSAWVLLTSSEALTALRLSLIASLSATAIALLLGVPLAWVYARVSFPGRAILRALTVLPMVLPPVVGGVALLLAFGRWAMLAPPLRMPATFRGVPRPCRWRSTWHWSPARSRPSCSAWFCSWSRSRSWSGCVTAGWGRREPSGAAPSTGGKLRPGCGSQHRTRRGRRPAGAQRCGQDLGAARPCRAADHRCRAHRAGRHRAG